MPIVGWRRVASATACDFCAMLASRGVVYSTEESASFEAHAPDELGRGGVCSCSAEPVYERAPDPPAVVALRDEFKDVTAGLVGTAAKLRAWRAHWRMREKPALTPQQQLTPTDATRAATRAEAEAARSRARASAEAGRTAARAQRADADVARGRARAARDAAAASARAEAEAERSRERAQREAARRNT